MDQVWEWLDYLRDNPMLAAGVVVGLGILYYWLNRKPKFARDADARFNDLRHQHDEYYREIRPPE